MTERGLNVFIQLLQTFFFNFCHVFTFLTFFLFFLERFFYIYDVSDGLDSCDGSFAPVLKIVLAKGHFVSGMTSLGAELFVVRTRSRDIEVYDSTTLEPVRRLHVPQLGNLPLDLAACPENRYRRHLYYRRHPVRAPGL